jgi:hypothetical protein
MFVIRALHAKPTVRQNLPSKQHGKQILGMVNEVLGPN